MSNTRYRAKVNLAVTVDGKTTTVEKGQIIPANVDVEPFNPDTYEEVAGDPSDGSSDSGGDAATEVPGSGGESFDVSGTIDEVIGLVDGDPVNAQAALDAELAKGDGARSGLVDELQRLLG